MMRAGTLALKTVTETVKVLVVGVDSAMSRA
jgi:hypothetical protein